MPFKVTQDFILKLSTSLYEDVSDNNRKTWAKFIVTNKVPLKDLVELVTAKHPIGMRFIWMVGDLADNYPETVVSSVKAFYDKRDEVKFPNYSRSLAKLFYRVGIPKEIEGEAINDLFTWLTDPKTDVSTKTFALLALQGALQKYPELKSELKAVVEDQMHKNSVSFKKKAITVLARIG